MRAGDGSDTTTVASIATGGVCPAARITSFASVDSSAARAVASAALILLVVLAGCGLGSEDSSATRTNGPAATPTPTPVPLSERAWRPEPGVTWAIQYSGELEVPEGVGVINLDMEETSKATIDRLHDGNAHVVCYLSAGSWEPYRIDADDFPDEVLGTSYEGFEDERWLDVRSTALRPLLEARIGRAAEKGCDAVDPDNVNGYENDTGFDLTEADQVAFNRWLFDEVHRAGMAVGLKNGLDLVPQLIDWVDFHVNEECIEQGTCAALAPFVEAAKPVWSIEYAGDPDEVCAQAAELGFATLVKDVDLGPGGTACPVA